MIVYVLAISYQRFEFWRRAQEPGPRYKYCDRPYMLRGINRSNATVVQLASFNEKSMTFREAMEWFETLHYLRTVSEIEITYVIDL